MNRVVLLYKRDNEAMTSSGSLLRMQADSSSTCDFQSVAFEDMLKLLAKSLADFPVGEQVDVMLQRTDREGLSPYTLQSTTVELFRTDPLAAIQSMLFTTQSPSTVAKNVKDENSAARSIVSIRAGMDTLADAFGDVVYFKVRAHELECPGCGFWGMYTAPGLLKARAGGYFKTTFVCVKKCGVRFVVTCEERWGFVDVSYLLDRTKLSAFFLPRSWNEGRPWISRESLQTKYDAFKKERAACLVTADQ